MNHLYNKFFLLWLLLLLPIWASDVSSDWLDQYRELQDTFDPSSKSTRTAREDEVPAEQVQNIHALIHPGDLGPYDVQLRRTKALIEDLKTLRGSPDLSDLERQVAAIEEKCNTAALAKRSSEYTEQEAFMALKKIQRSAALSNPLLDDVEDLLFVDRSTYTDISGGRKEFDGGHMCDQMYGHNARKQGGLYIVKGFKSGSPQLVNLLKGLKVPSGQHAGMAMEGGTFAGPDLSFDGKTIVFAWSSGGTKKFTKENRLHIFRINIDGSGLMRLTDGNNDDFDPCFLPNGRIAFISTRRGGYGRCHARPVPTYTLYSMKDDGSDIICLSYHETNEWHPSVDNNGMIVYTRWDYVDRDSDVAHHLWLCYPDGRDPRGPHGNYPFPTHTLDGKQKDGRRDRPFAEWSIRAIPNSNKYMATAGPHHGQWFGTIINIDIGIEDDNKNSQIKRLTPDVPYPQSVGWKGKVLDYDIYATAWPLSETYFIVTRERGIYLQDDKGNRDLIVNSPGPKAFRPVSPIPVAPRTKPPVIPIKTFQGERDSPTAPKALISIMNVFIHDMPWEKEYKKIKEMRIVQIFPKSTPDADKPRPGHANQGIARMSLGTVPVEDDGSVYCEAPVGKEIYFQLLDDEGMAVHSMRSGTYVHKGEHLTCIGCHESKWEAIPPIVSPKALKRLPSKIKPETSVGTEPMNFHRFARPVFNKHCTGCHEQKRKKPDFSYRSLAPYSWFQDAGGNGNIVLHVRGGSRTIAGRFGAHMSKLVQGGHLTEKHHDVNLSKDEKRRITMWLDLYSYELGAYHEVNKQRGGELVWPVYDVDPNNPIGTEIEKADVTEVTARHYRDPHCATILSRAWIKNGLLVVELSKPEKAFITLFSINGRELSSYTLKGKTRYHLPMSRIKSGIGVLTIRQDNTVFHQKVYLNH